MTRMMTIPGTSPMVASTDGSDRIPRDTVSAIRMMPPCHHVSVLKLITSEPPTSGIGSVRLLPTAPSSSSQPLPLPPGPLISPAPTPSLASYLGTCCCCCAMSGADLLESSPVEEHVVVVPVAVAMLG